jgi:hypothetical protein
MVFRAVTLIFDLPSSRLSRERWSIAFANIFELRDDYRCRRADRRHCTTQLIRTSRVLLFDVTTRLHWSLEVINVTKMKARILTYKTDWRPCIQR